MPASARLMVLMSPEERASLDAKARTLGVSAGEVVRRAVQAFELGTEEEAAEREELNEGAELQPVHGGEQHQADDQQVHPVHRMRG